MKTQTAMTQLLQWIRKSFPMDMDTPQIIESQIESLLEIERNQIIIAAARGYLIGEDETFPLEAAKEYGEQYYNETFNINN